MEEKKLDVEFEEPPGKSLRSRLWPEITTQQWNDWRWQMAHRLHSLDDFARVLNLTPAEISALSASGKFRVGMTPYLASLMSPDDPNCPIRRQFIPTAQELTPYAAGMLDSLGEDAHSPVPGVVHRYPDRVLMLVTTECANYCRFCTRSRLVGQGQSFNRAIYARQLDYIANTPQIRDVLISGGDPLTLPQAVLEGLLQSLRAIPHVEVIRIGTRAPNVLPQRIDDDLVAMLAKYHPLWMNIHFNHPQEITPEVEAALQRLANAGIPLGSQTVLLAGINDCPNVIMSLMHKLVRNRVRPYYLYQCDLVHGAGHFRTSVAKGLEIMEALRGHTSGFAIPAYVIDAPEGGGKVPVLPNYLLSVSDSKVVVRNYEGLISTYAQPQQYQPHNAQKCPYCQNQRQEGAQAGISGLLAGQARSVRPETWHSQHQHHATQAYPDLFDPQHLQDVSQQEQESTVYDHN